MATLEKKCLILGALLLQSGSAAFARTQWEIEHPPQESMNPTYGAPWQGGYGSFGQPSPTQPAQDPSTNGQPANGQFIPGLASPNSSFPQQSSGSQSAQWDKNFWQLGGLSNQIPTGSVLKGILENTISSSQSSAGSTFSIALPEGFAPNGIQIVPQGSKLVGAITSATPAARLRHGQAGNLEIAIQSLVLPDGMTIPFSGMIDSNPNHAFKEPPQKRFSGFDLADTGQMCTGMLNSFTNGSGYLLQQRHRGKDFLLEKGEVIPIRVTRTMVLPANPAMNSILQTAPALQPVPGLAEPPQQIPDPF